MKKQHTQRHLMISTLLFVAMLGGCEYAHSNPLLKDSNTKSTPAPTVKEIPEANQSTKPIAEQVVASVPVELTLSPGSTLTLPHVEGIAYLSSAPNIISVQADGGLTAVANATTGEQVLVTVSYAGVKKQTIITIKKPLEVTVAEVSGVPTVTNPADRVVVVNKQRSLPISYKPADLVAPNVPFTFSGKSEKRLLRSEAAKALEELFAQAKTEQIQLFGVSGYRSAATQKLIYENNLKSQGEEHTSKYNAYPGKSEHQTGLAIDVNGADRQTSLEESFAATPEGRWLATHAADFGFIIRYPKGKESITGYAYEPWHIRYVGKGIAKAVADKGITLEEYFRDAVPVLTNSTDKLPRS